MYHRLSFVLGSEVLTLGASGYIHVFYFVTVASEGSEAS